MAVRTFDQALAWLIETRTARSKGWTVRQPFALQLASGVYPAGYPTAGPLQGLSLPHMTMDALAR